MKNIYAVDNEAELQDFCAFAAKIQPQLDAYIQFVCSEYEVRELPRAIVWTNAVNATEKLSDIPVPAYTNDFRIMITPELTAWRKIYLKQLDGYAEDDPGVREIRRYYETELTVNHVLQILGHEIAHHSALFPDEGEVWGEEGMAEYISRRYFLTDEQFAREAAINRKLLALYYAKHGGSPAAFGQAKDYAGIFAAYWQSFLRISQIVDACGGDVRAALHRVAAL